MASAPGEEGSGTEGARLSRVLCQVERQVARRLDAVLATGSLTPDQWRVLDLLADGLGHTMSEIAAQIVVPGPTLTKIVDRLVDAALVYRLVDEADRRRVLVFASDEGRARHRSLAPLMDETEADLLALLHTDGAQLLELLNRLATGLRTPAGEPALPTLP